MKAIYEYDTPLDAMCSLHPEVKEWWQTLVCIAQMEVGLPPNPADYWMEMTEAEQWKLVAQLLKQTLPKNIEDMPKIDVEKIQKKPDIIKPSLPQSTPQNLSVISVPSTLPQETKEISLALPFTEDRIINPYEWVNQLHEINCLLIFGGQGSGKSTFIQNEIYERKRIGHDIILLDPHHKFGDFPDIPVFGKGLNYEEIDNKLLELKQTIKSRYLDISNVPNFNPKPLTIICEEFTNWSSRCKNSEEFFMTSLSDCRKVRFHIIYVSHADTLAGLTKRGGAGKLRDMGMTKLEILSTLDETGKAKPLFKGNLYYPNSKKPIEVDIPVFKREPVNTEIPVNIPNTTILSDVISQTDKDKLDSVFGI